MKQVLTSLNKLNKIKKGLTVEKKEDINKSVLAICEMIQ